MAGVCCAVLVAAVALTGCSAGGRTTGSAPATTTVGSRMAGPAVDVNVTPEAIASKPEPWVLTSPESAVRSYLDWTSYAYRIGQSEAAVPTMSSYEEVRVDSYIQYNIQKYRLIDQKLESITFGASSVKGSRAVLPAKEKWTYRYVSIETAGKTLEGPYAVSYDTTYTVVKSDKGVWVVDSVEATSSDTVK